MDHNHNSSNHSNHPIDESDDECDCCQHNSPTFDHSHDSMNDRISSMTFSDNKACSNDSTKEKSAKETLNHSYSGHSRVSKAHSCTSCGSDDDDCDCCSHDHVKNEAKAMVMGHSHGPSDHDHGHGSGNHGHSNHMEDEEEDDDDCDCCSHDHVKNEAKAMIMDHSHGPSGHDHGHGSNNHGHSNHMEDDEEDDDCDCCSHDHVKNEAKAMIMDHSHGPSGHGSNNYGHDHGHSNHMEDDEEDDDCDCCSHDHGSHDKHSNPLSKTHDHDHDHNSSNKSEIILDHSNCETENISFTNSVVITPVTTVTTATTITNNLTSINSVEDSVTISIHARVCFLCDERSDIPHAYQVTRLRVTNLCCSGEERIVRSCLEGLHGVNSVTVNIVGRYVIVKHCPIDCCAPTAKLVELLNNQRLGASIQEANDHNENESEESYVDWVFFTYWISLVSILLAGVIAMKVTSGASDDNVVGNTPALTLYVIGTAMGIIVVVKGAFISLLRKTLDIHVLMLIAIIGALISGEFFDACLLVTLFNGATLIEDAVMRTVRRAVKTSSIDIGKTALLASGKTVNVQDLTIGDIIAVRAGDVICSDGEVVKGDGVVNESALTGESLPVPKKVGMKVFGGTIVQNGYLEIKVTVKMEDSTMNKLKQTVDDMQADRGQYAKLVDQFAFYWTPVVLIAALILVLAGGGSTRDWNNYVYKGLVLLVLACPCSIVISAPIPSVCTIAIAARHGVLIKGSSVIEKLGSVNSLGVDKTGTLTKGFCKVLSKLKLHHNDGNISTTTSTSGGTGDNSRSLYNALELAAAVESKSTHPLANAVVSDFCGCIAEMDSDFLETKKIKVLEGVGVSGLVHFHNDWLPVHVGNERLLIKEDLGILPISMDHQQRIADFKAQNTGCSIIYVTVSNRLELLLAIADEIREEARRFVQQSKSLGLSVTMLTGDHQTVAEDVAKAVGIDTDITTGYCKYRLLPQDKLAWVQYEQDIKKKKVIMIGDGINDATALTMATCGVAMGEGGSAMTITAADLVIMSDNLLRIPSSIELCRVAKAIIIQNCTFSIAVKIAASALAILGMLSLWNAVLVDLGTLLVVILNGTRPFLFKKLYESSSLDKFMNVEDPMFKGNKALEMV